MESSPADLVAPDALWPEEIWADLLDGIRESRVIPIIGPDLVQVESGGERMPLERFLARELTRRLRFSGPVPPAGSSLPTVAWSYLRGDAVQRRKAITREIAAILEEADFAAPEPLLKLAEITNLTLFVTTTFDGLLEKALDQVRGGSGKDQAKSLVFRTNHPDDIEASLEARKRTTVYHLLGTLSTTWPYVLTEEDLLEFVRELQAEEKRPENLFDELNGSHLLLLGEGFADWLARLFLRTTKKNPLSYERDVQEVLADSSTPADKDLVGFLRLYSRYTRVFPDGGGIEFVNELHRRWTATAPGARPKAPPGLPKMPPGAVFLSYSRRDRAAVEHLKERLEREPGVTAWYDSRDLEYGDEWLPELEDYIAKRCSLFIPVLSADTEARQKSKFRREWNCALERDKDHTGGLPFIMPVALDGTSFVNVPPRFKQLHFPRLDEDGPVTDRFAARIAELVAAWKAAQP